MIQWKNKNKIDERLIRYLELASLIMASEPIVLDDYRKNDPKEHGKGNAVDTVWPELKPLFVLDTILQMNLFGGVGIYVNEKNFVSFHFDIRPHKPNGGVATWYGKITYPNGKKHIEYLAMSLGIERIKKWEQ